MTYQPKRVIQILSGSRTGSSLLHRLLSKSPDITSLAGEEEPYLTLAGNGYGLTSDSDAYTDLVNPKLVREYIHRELTDDLSTAWERRLHLQFEGTLLNKLLSTMPDFNSRQISNCEHKTLKEITKAWLTSCGVWGHYDGCEPNERLPVAKLVKEMFPLVMPRQLQTTKVTDTLLLKCPYNTYRPKIMEQVYPDAEFTYIILVRNPAATINGLIDGWLAPYGFQKHLTPYGWWCFDLPPRWENLLGLDIPHRCKNQWKQSYRYLLNINNALCVIQFEELIKCPSLVLNKLTNLLGIEPVKLKTVPKVMTTANPRLSRWKDRASIIQPLVFDPRILEMTDFFGYSNDIESWV